MIVNSISGTASLIYANERVRLATVDTDGHLTWCAYVHRTKTLHEFDAQSTMFNFCEHYNLIPASEPVLWNQYVHRMTTFVMRMFAERAKPGASFHQARTQMTAGHSQTRGTGMFADQTWTEYDDEAFFGIPHGYHLASYDPKLDAESSASFHKKGCGWSYEALDEILIQLTEIHPDEAFPFPGE